MKLIGKQKVQKIKCPHCGADLQLIPPPPGAMTLQVVTTLHCPVCGWPVITVPNSGYQLEVVQTGQPTMGASVYVIRCPKCGTMYQITPGRATTYKDFKCLRCGTSLGSFPTDSWLALVYVSPAPQPPKPTPPGYELYII
jgi:DNA-directed RNA polymerase subunit RPC12/RpoP